MTPKRIVWPVIGVIVLALATLIVAGAQSGQARAYVLGAPDYLAVAHLRSGVTVCQGPLTPTRAAAMAGVWGSAPAGGARVKVVAYAARGGAWLGSGTLTLGSGAGERRVRLSPSLPAGRPVRLCLIGQEGTFALSGSGAVRPGVTMTGGRGGAQFSLVLLNDHSSLFAGLSTAFSRASLWRPSWVGSWTFWLLTVALLATFGLAAVAVAGAAADDEVPPPDRPDGPTPDEPSPYEGSETGQDRPQPVS